MNDIIHRRRTIHRFLPEPVPTAVLERALEAAHQAPCHRLTWPWRFYVVGPAARQGLVPIAVAEKERKAPLVDEVKAGIARAIMDPGALVIVTVIRDARPDTDSENRLATACAIQNMMLSVTADGYGSKWTTGGFTRADATWTLLGLDRTREDIVGGVWIGVPAAVPEIVRPPWRDHAVWVD